MPVIIQPHIAPELLEALRLQMDAERQVIVHVQMIRSIFPNKCRVWPEICLSDQASDSRSPLLHAENISLYPQWTHVPPLTPYGFTLLFAALPATCTRFDLLEEIPEPGGFFIRNIERKPEDIYLLTIG